MFEVLKKGGAGLIDIVSLAPKLFWQPAVVVPATVEELNEANIALDKSSREEAVAGKGTGFPNLGSVEIEDVLRFTGKVGKFRHGHLHSESHLLLGDGCLNLWVAHFFHVLLIHLGDEIEHLASGGAGNTGRVGEEEDGVAGGLESDALMFRREES